MPAATAPPSPRPERPPLLFLKGALMGAADVIPGVSGGTVALLVGVYERLITGLSTLFSVPGRLVREGPAAARRRLAEVPFPFLVTLGLGILVALLVGAHLIPGFIETYPVVAAALFFGLILGSVPVAWRRIETPGAREVALAALAALVAFLLVGFPPRTIADPAWWAVLLGAMLAITAMVLPGVSGAYLLLAVGLYGPTLEAVARFDVSYLLLFLLGAGIGAVFIVRALGVLLVRARNVTLAVLVGLMIGALRATWPWLTEARRLEVPPMEAAALAYPVAAFLLGFLAVRGLDLWAQRARSEDVLSAQE